MTTVPPAPPGPRSRNPEGEFPSGPTIGERLPDFALPDQLGRMTSLGALTGTQGAVVVFIRATSW